MSPKISVLALALTTILAAAGASVLPDAAPADASTIAVGPSGPTGTGNALAVGQLHTCALTIDGAARCWGDNYYGQLGTTTNNGTDVANPIEVTADPGPWLSLTAGGDTTCGIKIDNSGWCWGANYFGQLGTAANNSANPTPIQLAGNWTTISAGNGFTCGIQSSGTLWCWGWNIYGQLGTPTGSGNPYNATPQQIQAPGQTTGNWTSVSTGGDHVCGVRSDGTLWCWGDDGQGQLGPNGPTYGNDTANPTPVQVPGIWVGVTAGIRHTCGLQADGSAWCWGDNEYGQAGPAATAGNGPALRQVPGTWTSLSAGSWQTCGVQASGSAYCWGRDDYGQLGSAISANTSPTPVPEQVSGSWAVVGGGALHSCGVETDGTVWCWGDNAQGQLGNAMNSGTNTPNAAKVSVGISVGVQAPPPQYVAMGDSFSSGEGNSPFFPDSASLTTGDKCDRSYAAYSQLLPAIIPGLATAHFVACSGAISSDLFNPNHNGNSVAGPTGDPVVEGPQISTSGLSSTTKLVTLTIGGNDLGFPDLMKACVQAPAEPGHFFDPVCELTSSVATGAATRLRALESAGSFDSQGNPLPTTTNAEGSQLKIYSWQTIIKEIHKLAPNAAIAVAGYPELFDPTGPGFYLSLSGDVCDVGYAVQSATAPSPGQSGPGTNLVIWQDEAQWIWKEIHTIDAGLSAAVTNSGIAQAKYVAPSGFGTSHALCDTSPWIFPAAASALSAYGEQIWPGSFHPTATGQRLGYAASFASALPQSF